MNPRPIGVLLAGCCLAPLACQSHSSNNRSTFDRDPLVMSHLTHRRDDPAFAESESDVGKEDETPIKPASISKSNKPVRPELTAAAYGGPSRGRAPDYSWLRGSVRYHRDDGGENGWYIHYGRSEKDRYEGKLRLASSPRLGLLREGDEVQITGRLIDGDGANPIFQVESLIQADGN
jgi:hypothetical protein